MGKRKQKPAKLNLAQPTPERIAGHETRREGMATRITPPIDTLLTKGRITQAEHKALGHYAEQKALAEASPLTDSLGKLLRPMGGSGSGYLPAAVLSAQMRVRWLDGELGQLRPIAEAIAVEEITLTQWVCRNGEGRLKCENVEGHKICKPYADKPRMDIAVLELTMAARRLVAAIAA